MVPSGSRVQTVNVRITSSILCHSFKIVSLSENVRLQNFLQDPAAPEELMQLPQFLAEIGEEKVSDDASNYINLL